VRAAITATMSGGERKFAALETNASSANKADTFLHAVTHPFLSDDVRNQLREDIRNMYLPNAEAWVLEDGGITVGFIAMIDREIGGLFVAPSR
jgi:hypothetical protein